MEKAGEESTEEVDAVRKHLTSERPTRAMRINKGLAIFDEEGPNRKKF
jgi:hypothetical protein